MKKLLKFQHWIIIISFSVRTRYSVWNFKVPFEIPHKIYYPYFERCISEVNIHKVLYLTHWGRDKMDIISQMAFWSEFSWMKGISAWIPIKISVKVVPKGPINNIPALVLIMAWHRPGNKPLSEPMMVRLLIYIYASFNLNELWAQRCFWNSTLDPEPQHLKEFTTAWLRHYWYIIYWFQVHLVRSQMGHCIVVNSKMVFKLRDQQYNLHYNLDHMIALVQERHNSSALAMELCLPCTTIDMVPPQQR